MRRTTQSKTETRRTNLSPTSSAASRKKFQPPANPLAYLTELLPFGSLRYFTRRGIGVRIICPFCRKLPPDEMSGYQRWRWLTAHIASRHHGTERPQLIGAKSGLEHSQERKRPLPVHQENERRVSVQ
jgi:hypothetical protein